MRKLPVFIFLIIIVCIQTRSEAQYFMQDTLVTDCEGSLSDSDQGPIEGQYDHNEDFTFTICVEGAQTITAIFSFFATEADYDILTVYDGPDTNAPIIAELSGIESNPPILIANSGCMTFHFASVPENFQLIGPDGSGISSATALDCDSDNTASMYNITFADSLSLSGNYTVIFNGYIINTCDDTLYFESLVDFVLTDCPFEVQIVLLEQACPENCGQVEVEIYSSDAGPYSINWSHTTDNSEIVDICSDSSVLIDVLVVNTMTGSTGEDQFLYTPLPSPSIINPLQSDTFCSSNSTITLNADISGGVWNSNIMDNQEEGHYRFYRWNWSSNIEEDFIVYTDPNGCVAHDTVYIIPSYAGLDQAVCLSQEELQLSGNNPANGIWSGPNTTVDGIFTTTIADTFDVSFTTAEGCVDWKRVFVVDNIEFSEIDTVCSNTQFNLSDYVNSIGGVWSGPGINNWYTGRLRAWQANINEWNTYYYEMEGCVDSLQLYIIGIWAGPDISVCSEMDILQLRFAGQWSGPGIYNPIDSTYDISNLAPGEYQITGSQAGCSDRFDLTIYDVYLNNIGPEIYCHNADPIPIRDVVGPNPWDGTFYGDAVVDIFGEIYFDPSQINASETYIYFNSLDCTDSVLIQIEEPVELSDYAFCESGGLQNLDSEGNIGYWDGNGILVPETGLINPVEMNIGNNTVYFITSLGCATPVNVEITEFMEAQINNIEETYCFQDSTYLFDLFPSTGTFLINGEVSSPEINPADLGTGYHELEYIVGSGDCEDRMSVFIVISDAISGNTYALLDTLCPDESTTIFVETFGGNDNITAIWNQGLGFGKSHTISPSQSTIYNVTLSDGCSDEIEIPLNIHVIDTFNVGVIYGPEVCYGDSSYIELILDQSELYDITWDNETSIDEHILNTLPGSFQVNITNQETGCQQEYTLDVPGSEPIGANFNFIPNQECIDIIDNELVLINLAFGYTEGFINFGVDDNNVDLLTGDLTFAYEDIGEFQITQIVFNELGCSDTLIREICVENRVRLFIPNLFSPNGDDINDLFTIHGLGVTNFSIRIYDRWGSQVFKSNDMNNSWDGTHNGLQVQQGVYAIVVQYEDQDTGKPYLEYFDVTVVR